MRTISTASSCVRYTAKKAKVENISSRVPSIRPARPRQQNDRCKEEVGGKGAGGARREDLFNE